MRIFIALKISDKLQNEVESWQKNRSDLPVRWISAKNLHITLVPPWEENDVVSVKSALDNINRQFQPIQVLFNNICFGPNKFSPRLIWATGQAPKVLSVIKNEIENLLSIQPENRKLLLHLTLARFRAENFSSFKNKDLNDQVNWHDTIDSIVLMESVLLPGGADYNVIHQVKL